jgi:hypothetical protein
MQLGFPIRKSTDHSLFAAPRGLSQLITSFIACSCQGIRHTLLVTCAYVFTCNRYSILALVLSDTFQFITETHYVKRTGLDEPGSGVSRTRTDDPLLAKQVLYQLSYNPA